MNGKTVLAFGTFDGIHEGHKYFLRNAKSLGDKLFVGVARDAHVRELKNKEPERKENGRVEAIAQLPFVDKALLSDEKLGTYEIIQSVKPDIIAIGHDQDELFSDLKRWLGEHEVSVETKRIRKQ